ncbi:MAG: heme-dependent oxidative N-demethylase subunit alpha family protein [Pseudomonadota bacterium]
MDPLALYPSAFQIGTRPKPIAAAWLAPDENLSAHIDDKRRICAEEEIERYFMARPDTRAAQQEVWDLLTAHLPTIAPDRYRLNDAGLLVDGEHVRPDGDDLLLPASMLVADDLVLMRRHDDGWRLVAASLFAPSYWTLAEKFDRPLQIIHGPVPGFGPDSRKAALITRMFDSLSTQFTLERRNWSFHGDGVWFQPGHHPHNVLDARTSDAVLAGMYVRREYQTIRKLAGSGDVLFTIHVSTQTLADVRRSNEAAELAGNLRSLDSQQRAYKGLEAGLDRLAAYLAG